MKHLMRMKVAIVVAVCAVAFAVDGWAATYYVNGTSGSDSNAGTSSASAKKTIQAAVDAASLGDTILVSAGTYGIVDATDKGITIRSTDGAVATIIDGGGKNTCIKLGSSNTVLEGFTLQNGYAGAYSSAAVHGGTIRHCIIRQCYGFGYGGASGAALTHAYDTLAYDNEYGGTFGGGVFANSEVVNCTVVNNIGYGLWDGSIRNTISWNNKYNGKLGYDVYVSRGCEGHVNYSLTTTVLSHGTGNISGDPKFIDAANYDFSLSASSPCLNAGNPNDTDPDGSRADIGCRVSTLPTTANLLYCGIVYSSSGTLYPAVTNICSYPEMATSCQRDDGDVPGSVYGRQFRTWVYWGEMYLEAGTYRVASTFDDSVYMKVDGALVVDAHSWESVAFDNFTIEESGWHAVEFRFVNNWYETGDTLYHNKGRWVERKNLAIQKITNPEDLDDETPENFAIPGFDVHGNEVAGTFRLPQGAQSGTDSPRKTISCSAMNVTATYDGKGHGIAVEISTRGNFTVQYAKSANGPWYSSLLVTDAGAETIYYRVSATGYETATGSATVIVLPRSVTLTSASASKKYDGTPLTARSVAVSDEGFVPGEGATFNVTGSQTSVGSSKNTFSYSLTGNTHSANYSIFKIEGTLTVSSKSTVPDPDDPDDPEPDDPELDPIFNTAQTFNGWLTGDGFAGTIKVKTTKATANRKTGVVTAKATATVSVVGGKKQTFSGNLEIDEDGTYGYLEVEKNGRYLYIEMSSDGLYGEYSDDEYGYEIQGMRDLFASKDSDDKAYVSEVLANWKKTVRCAWQSESDDESYFDGYNTMTFTVGAKGKTKIAGTLVDGTKFNVTSQMIIGGDGSCYIPVIVSKKGVSLSFNLVLSEDGFSSCTGDGIEVDGLDMDYFVVGSTTEIFGDTLTAEIDTGSYLWDVVGGDEGYVYTEFLPDGLEIAVRGTKLTLPKAGKVVMDRYGDIDYDRAGENPSGLKLSYKAKDGTFTGSFKAYVDYNGRLKTVTVSVSGLIIEGIGYGTATVKKVGSVPFNLWGVTHAGCSE